jgi:hypothetical protein
MIKIAIFVLFFSYLFSQKDVGLQFDEHMSGFYADGDLPYERAYEYGKQRNQRIRYLINF